MLLQQMINGITVGGSYALIALGYTMVYGILKIVNFAHGDVFMMGSFLGCSVCKSWECHIMWHSLWLPLLLQSWALLWSELLTDQSVPLIV